MANTIQPPELTVGTDMPSAMVPSEGATPACDLVPERKRFQKVLLLDGYSTRTLACVRSWGKNGVPFAVGGETRWDMSLLSRYAREQFVYTSPKRDATAFVRDLNRYSEQFGADCIFPTSEAAIMVCSQHRDALMATPIVPRAREIQLSFSKANTLRLAEAVGIAVPKTVFVTPDNPEIGGASTLRFPVVVKSESSEVMLSGRIGTSKKTAYVFDWRELERECKTRLAEQQSILIQEFIDGFGVGVSGLFEEGRPIVLFGHRRIRESNPLGGPSALAESIAIEPSLLHATTELFEKIGFTGPAMAEYKVDRRNGQAFLMEINGRFWGSILLAPAAGLDLPYLYWKQLNGLEITPEEKTYKVGVKGRYLVGDASGWVRCLKGKPKGWPGEFPKRWRATSDFFASFFDKHTTDLILDGNDPLPLLGRLIQELR
jgi:predicted ATP-grasp superfamily ATP-dependent carboligase